MKKAVLWILCLHFFSPSLFSLEGDASASPESPAPTWVIPPELQESLGEQGLSPEVKPWAAGVAGTASGVFFILGYRSLTGALEAAQAFRPVTEIHTQAFSGGAFLFAGACLGIILKDILWPPEPPQVISAE